MNAPTLLNSCARAATAAEARYRIDYPNSRARASRIIALDREAAEVMARAADASSAEAHFLTYVSKRATPGIEALAVDATLADGEGAETRLSSELAGADVVVMIATAHPDADAAAVIGNACFVRGIMTAGLIITADRSDESVDRAIHSLRPYAAVLVVAAGEDYVPAMLQALRA